MPKHSFSIAATRQANGHKTYLQPGDQPFANPSNTTSFSQPWREPFQGAEPDPSTRRFPLWSLVFLSGLVSSLVTLYGPSYITKNLVAYLATPEQIFLAEQSVLYDAYQGGQNELLNMIFRAVLAAPNHDTFRDSVQDPSIFKQRPLKLADGRMADESNASFVRVYDAAGKLHMAILAVDTVEVKGLNTMGRLSGTATWADNSTPIQKWIIGFEIELRKKAATEQDPSGNSAGLTLVYMTRDTLGVGAFGPIKPDAEGKVYGLGEPDIDCPAEVFMQCMRFDGVNRGWNRPFSDRLRTIKHERDPRPKPKVDDRPRMRLDGVRRPDGTLALMLIKPDGTQIDLATYHGSLTSRRGPGKNAIISDRRPNGEVVDIYTWSEEEQKKYGFTINGRQVDTKAETPVANEEKGKE